MTLPAHLGFLCSTCIEAIEALKSPDYPTWLVHECPVCHLTLQIFIDAERDSPAASAESAAPASPSCVVEAV